MRNIHGDVVCDNFFLYAQSKSRVAMSTAATPCPTFCPPCPVTGGSAVVVIPEENKKKGILSWLPSPMMMSVLVAIAAAVYWFYFRGRARSLRFPGR